MSKLVNTSCIVVAAGKGERAGFGINKLFVKLAGISVLSRTLRAVEASGEADEIILVLAAADIELYKQTAAREGACGIVAHVVTGGATRAESVKNGLAAISPDAEVVLIHDGARPFVTKEIIENTIEDALKYGSGVISTPVTDTVKRCCGLSAVETIDRSVLRAVQTPQAFKAELIKNAYADGTEATDDAAQFERKYGSVHLTQANSAGQNIKLTCREDFILAENLLSAPRVGTGYDVHRLVCGRQLVLCGTCIPYEKGLLGHSDADVAVHALIDALLGAAALGDIGRLFPDSDDKYKDISSMVLLKSTLEACLNAGFKPVNCDITIVCQKPKLAGYIPLMRKNIADTLLLPIDCVSVKATTTEGLGFEGEGLGISASAVAGVKKFFKE